MERESNTVKKLSMREREVLQLTSFGLSQKEAADRMGISHFTVDQHMKHIKEKTGMQKATELEMVFMVNRFHIAVNQFPVFIQLKLQTALMAFSA